MRKRTLRIIVCVVLAAVILGVCLLPWPTKIDLHMQGAAYKADGTRMQEVDFTVTGWKLNYLFFGERLRVDFAFKGNYSSLMYARSYASGVGETAKGKPLPVLSNDQQITVHFQSFDSRKNDFTFGYFVLSRDLSHCVFDLFLSDEYFIATADGKGDTDALFKQLQEGEIFPWGISEDGTS